MSWEKRSVTIGGKNGRVWAEYLFSRKIRITIGENGVLYDSDKKTELGVTLSNMEWTRIAVVFHVADHTRDVYIDGKLLQSGQSTSDFTDYDVTAIRLAQIKSNTGSENYVYADNFECYYGAELK